MISASAGRERARDWERLEKSWVVEGPMTDWSAVAYEAASGGVGTYFGDMGVDEIGGGLEAGIILLRRFLTDVVGRTELNVGFFKVGSDAGEVLLQS